MTDYAINIDPRGASLIDALTGERILGLYGAPIDCRSVLEALRPYWHSPYRCTHLTAILKRSGLDVRVGYSAYPMSFEPSWVFSAGYVCAMDRQHTPA